MCASEKDHTTYQFELYPVEMIDWVSESIPPAPFLDIIREVGKLPRICLNIAAII